MSVSNLEKSKRRRILFRSLDKGTPVEVVQLAIDLLDNEFGSQSEMRYTALIKRLKEVSDHDAFRSANLLGRIMMVRNKSVDQIGPDPVESMQGSGSNSSRTPAVVLKGRDLVFNTLLQHITDAVAKRSPKSEASYREYFVKESSGLGLSTNSCKTKLVAWAKSENSKPAIVGPDKDLQKIVNTAFVWMCQKFGPVFADKMLLYAVNLTEQLPEAFDHPPRKFL